MYASTLLSWLLYSLRVSAVLDHFGYPAPHLDQWQQRIWYDLGATQEILHQMHIRLSRGLSAIASPPRAKSPPPSRRPAAAPIHPNHWGKFIKASKGESSDPSTVSTGPSSPIATTSPKTEGSNPTRGGPARFSLSGERCRGLAAFCQSGGKLCPSCVVLCGLPLALVVHFHPLSSYTC